MSEHPAATRIDLPPSWAAKVLPRRGRGAFHTDLDPDAPALLRKAVEAESDLLDQALDMRKNRRHADAVAAYRAGEPDAKGAAATVALLSASGVREPEWWHRTELHAWVQTHGLAWTVRARIERAAVETDALLTFGTRRPLGRFVLKPADLFASRPLLLDLDSGTAAALRALLAAASDAEYAAAEAAAAEHRTTPAHRLAAALYFPDRPDWVAEAGEEHRAFAHHGDVGRLLMHAATSATQLAAMGIERLDPDRADPERMAALLHAVGADALPILARTLEAGFLRRDAAKTLHKAVALLGTDEAAAYLLTVLDRPFAFDAAAESAARAPAATLRAVAAAAATADQHRRTRLAALVAMTDPEGATGLSTAERDALDRLTADTRAVPDADPADLPELLTAPPWTRKHTRTAPAVLDGLEPPAGTVLCWPPGERERVLRDADAVMDYQGRDELAAYWHEYAETIRHTDRDSRLGALVAFGPFDLAERMAPVWAERPHEPGLDEALAIMARFGAIGVPAAHRAREYCGAAVLLPVLDTDAARFAAASLLRGKTTRAAAVAWLDHHGPAAVPHLVPDALGADRKARTAAEAALGHLAARFGAEAVIAAAEPQGPEAVAAVRRLVGDPLVPVGVKVPKPGAWAAAPLLPQVLLRDGERALPAASVPHLLTVLALAAPDYPYPGLDVVAETCDRASLTRFSLALFEQWLAVGAPAKDQWALTQLAHFAEDETVWTLARRVRAWPGEGQHRRAVVGLEVLGAIGTEEALRAIQGIADTCRYEALQEEASVQIEAIAAGLGLDRDRLADRLVPDFGLGDEDALALDYGPRRFTVAFDEHLKPQVIDDAGKRRKTLPKPGAKDDPDLAEAAYRRFGALKKELKDVAAKQVARLEAAMCAGRTWSPDEFRRFFADHALTGHLARRLVWLAEHDGTVAAFRIAEDGTLGDVRDDHVTLPADAVVRIAHPAHLADTVDTWARLLADYEILQPFAQLARPVMAFTETELDTGRLARFEGATVEVGRLLGMTRSGWRYAHPEDGVMSPGLSRPLPDGRFVTVTVEPGIDLADPLDHPEQTVVAVRIGADDAAYRRPERVDPVAASETLAALARLTRSTESRR